MKFSHAAKIYVYDEPVSMACGFNRLSEMVKKGLKKEPDSQDLYVFVNKKRKYLKILFYYRNGFCLFAKRLHNSVFDSEGLQGKITLADMNKLLNEVIVHGSKRKSRLAIAA